MSVEQAAADILREIQKESAGDGTGAAAAQRLVDGCSRSTDSLGISLTWSITHAAPLTIASTKGPGQALELAGFVLGEGPQMSCADTNRIVLRPSLDESSAEWPGFTPEALRLGVKAVFAFPLRLGAISLGALTLYRMQPGTLSDEHLKASLAYAAAATGLLLEEPVLDPGREDTLVLPSVLEDPFELQADVHQATGMISAQIGTDLGTALSLLRARAFSNSEPIIDTARAVISLTLQITWETSLPDPDESESE